MSKTSKTLSERDGQQTLQLAFNDVDATITTNGFLVGKVGRKIVQTISTTSVSNDTATFAFSESGIALYSLKVIYTDSSQSVMLSAERIS